MDGLLVDSEPLWHQAEKNAFAKVGISLTTDDCYKTIGIPTREVIQYWYGLSPWQNKTLLEVEEDLYKEIRELLSQNATAMPGVVASLQAFKTKGMKIGLASASPMDLIEIVIKKLEIQDFFDFHHSGTLETANKPDPAIYHRVAKKMEVAISDCLVFEDSVNGVKGAKASGAKVVAVPDPYFFSKKEFEIADFKIKSMLEIANYL
jgi:mannitol-1-/sugar-/sorbitol-6-/2-deoxyglucose-6-phosphatase